MRYERILRKVLHEPWLITESGHDTIVRLIESKMAEAQESMRPTAARPKEDFWGEALPQMDISEGIATIPIKGVIGAGLGAFEKSCGAVDTGDIAEEINTAIGKKVKAIILDIDSPGGTVAGTPELAEHILEANASGIEVHAFTAGMMASAAYWIGASAYSISATKTADVGSIGVYLPWVDRSRAYENAGVKVELIKAGKLKGAGYPGTQLSDEQRAHLQEGVDDIHAMFKGHVRGQRGNVPDSAMQGQTFMAEKGAANGLVDHIVRSISDVRREILGR